MVKIKEKFNISWSLLIDMVMIVCLALPSAATQPLETRGATIHNLGVSIYCLFCITIQWYIAQYGIMWISWFYRWTEPFSKTMILYLIYILTKQLQNCKTANHNTQLQQQPVQCQGQYIDISWYSIYRYNIICINMYHWHNVSRYGDISISLMETQ